MNYSYEIFGINWSRPIWLILPENKNGMFEDTFRKKTQ